MRLRRDEEEILHLHALVRRAWRQARTAAPPALAEEERGGQAQLEIRKVQADAGARAGSEGRVDGLCIAGLRCEPALRIEAIFGWECG